MKRSNFYIIFNLEWAKVDFMEFKYVSYYS
jgi:hypothetical protein